MNIQLAPQHLYCILETTVSSLKCAKKIAEALLTKKLAFCVQVQTSPVKSYYSWNDSLECSEEFVVKAKMKTCFWKQAVILVKAYHSYETPQCIQIPITKCDDDYEAWANSVSL